MEGWTFLLNNVKADSGATADSHAELLDGYKYL